MEFELEGSIEQVLHEGNAEQGDRYIDDFGNQWIVHDDRDGLRLQLADLPDAWIPYNTAMRIKLPGLRRA